MLEQKVLPNKIESAAQQQQKSLFVERSAYFHAWFVEEPLFRRKWPRAEEKPNVLANSAEIRWWAWWLEKPNRLATAKCIFIKFKSSQNTERDSVCYLIRAHSLTISAFSQLLSAAFGVHFCPHLYSNTRWITFCVAENDLTFVAERLYAVRSVCLA